jgi:RNA polymerase sigma-70 factor (ECF subfamily)
MLLVKEGHLSELTELFERYHVKLFNFFRRLTLDKATSEDLTQNLFYRVIKYRQSYKPEQGTFQSWIYRMARNVHSDFARQSKRVPDRPGNRESNEEEEGEDLALQEDGFTEDHYIRLERAMARLEPDQREVITLKRFQGLKYEEIAMIRELTVPAIKVQVHRALKKLKELYFKEL